MVSSLGSLIIISVTSVVEIAGIFVQTLIGVFVPPYRYSETMKQLDFVLSGSLFIVLFCVSFAAMVTILESSFHMKIVIQNDSMVPGFASMLIVRELAAVVTALLVTSRVGAGITAEVGTMKITEQIDALKMLSLEPIKFIVVPRFIACTIGLLVLTVFACLVCLICAAVVSDIQLGFTHGMFLTGLRRFVGMQDLIFTGIKGLCFGAVIPLIACYFGFRCKSGAEGVGVATTNSVVACSIAVIFIDFILTYIFSHFY